MGFRGISFEADQKQKFLLKSIMEPMVPVDYYWYRPQDQEEVWSRPDGQPFFSKHIYTGDEMKNIICADHLVVFLRLEAYSQKEDISYFTSFSEYCKSNCQIAILIYDCKQVRIYIKNAEKAARMYSYYKSVFKNVRYLTDENDTRTGMNIL